MIKLEELRIGNLIKDIESGRIGYVISIGEKKCTVKMPFSKLSQSYEEFEPIELTEEWLLKFAFEKRIDGHYNLLNESEVDIIIHKDLDHWRCDGICFSVNHFDYVHQLQNLYFALTGSELTIKEGK